MRHFGCRPVIAFAAASFFLVPALAAEPTTLRAKLAQKVTLEKGIEAGTSLGDALDFLSETYKVPFRIDQKSFKEIGLLKAKESQVRCAPMKGVSLGAVLEILTGQLRGNQAGGSFVIRKDHVLIVPNAGAFAKEIANEERSSSLRMMELGRKVELEKGIPAKTPLWQALVMLRDSNGVIIRLNTAGFTKLGVEEVDLTPVKLDPQAGLTLGKALDLLTAQVKAAHTELAKARVGLRVRRYVIDVEAADR
jgi:hypothetical protein